MKRALCILLLLCLSANYSYSDLDTSVSSKKRVLIGSPIRQKPAILKEFLQSLEELSRQDIICDYLFVDDNTDQASTLMLEEFSQKVSPHCRIIQPVARDCANTYVCNEITHYWRANIIWKVAAFKDSIINSATQEDYDYLFLIDSDMVLHPKTLEQLIIDNKDIVAEIWWTNWTPNTVKQASVWLTDNYTQYEINPGEELTEQQKQCVIIILCKN